MKFKKRFEVGQTVFAIVSGDHLWYVEKVKITGLADNHPSMVKRGQQYITSKFDTMYDDEMEADEKTALVWCIKDSEKFLKKATAHVEKQKNRYLEID